MTAVGTPLVALVGFKRSKLAWAGGMRVLVVRDGVVRLLGKRGRVDLETGADTLSARLTRTRTVELRSPAGSGFVYGVMQLAKIPDELTEIMLREAAEDAELIGATPPGILGVYSVKAVRGQAQAGRAIADALHERGVAAS